MANEMKGMTLNQLYKEIGEAIKKGYGDKPCVIADDDECNGFHRMWYSVTTMEAFGIKNPSELGIFHKHGMTNEELFDCVIIG